MKHAAKPTLSGESNSQWQTYRSICLASASCPTRKVLTVPVTCTSQVSVSGEGTGASRDATGPLAAGIDAGTRLPGTVRLAARRSQ